MDFGFSDDQREIQRTARELLRERARPERVREHAEAGLTDDALWRELSELGWPGIAIAEEHGGQGLGLVELSILCEELGRSVAPVPFLPSVLASTLIERAGSAGQCARWLPALARGDVTGAIGVAADGTAELVIGAPGASVIVLIEADRSARLLTPEQADVSPVPAIDPTRSSARVSASEDAGEPLGEAVETGVDCALVAVSSELVGVCEQALETTVAYVKERRQFGVPVGAFQAVSHRCADMLLDTEKARATTAFAAWTADADRERLPEAASMAKAAAAHAGRQVTASAIQAHGGIGFTWEADIHWLYKRAQLDATLLGGASEHRLRLARLLQQRASSRFAAR
jgi:alkylation response protein AidB-like acyl-CoA dehydrogenase